MRHATRSLLPAASLLATLVLPAGLWAQTFSLAPGSPTVPAPGPGGPPFSPFGDILIPGAPPIAFVPMGPPGFGLGWPGPAAGADVDAFSAGLTPIPPGPIPPGLLTFIVGVDPLSSGDAGGCVPLAPGPFAPDVGSEAAALTDAPADVFATCFGAPGCPPPPGPMPIFAPYTMPNFQIFDGDGVPAPPFLLPPAAPLGLIEPLPPGDNQDAFDSAPIAAWATPLGLPAVPVYFSVDPPTAFGAGFLPSTVIATVGGFLAAPYAAPPALGLDLIAGPGSDDLDGLAVFDADGMPFAFAPGAGDVVLFSVTAASAIVGTPSLCPGPLLGYPIGPGDILTEGTALGAPGAACVLVPATNVGLWKGVVCGGPNPLGAADDNIDALDVAFPIAVPTPTATATPTPTVTVTPGGPTATATPTPSASTTPVGPTATPTVTPTSTAPTTTATPTPTATPACAASPIAGCRTPAVAQKAFLMLKDKAPDDAKDLLQWKWSKGSATTKADFGAPLTSTSYQLCIYNGAAVPILDATIPAGGLCNAKNPKACWKDKKKGFDYKDNDLTPDGIQQLKLKEGVDGKAQIILKGKGALLDDPTIPLTLPVTVQLRNTDGFCWEAAYSTTIKNTAGPPGLFKAKAD